MGKPERTPGASVNARGSGPCLEQIADTPELFPVLLCPTVRMGVSNFCVLPLSPSLKREDVTSPPRQASLSELPVSGDGEAG